MRILKLSSSNSTGVNLMFRGRKYTLYRGVEEISSSLAYRASNRSIVFSHITHVHVNMKGIYSIKQQ